MTLWLMHSEIGGYFRAPLTIGERIAELRIARGWSRRQLARKAGLDYQSVYNHETGRYRPYPRNLAAYASAFHLSFRQFVSVTELWRDYQYVPNLEERFAEREE